MPTIGQRFAAQLQKALTRYGQDLSALPESTRSTSPGGKARTAYDYTYEVAHVFERFENRIKGIPVPPPGEGWMTAPDGYRSLEPSLAYLNEAGSSFVTLLEGLSDAEFDREIPMGPTPWSLFDVVSLAVVHVNYHDGQLNLLQSMEGDLEMHWG